MLGRFEVDTGRGPITHFRTHKTGVLLAYLAAHLGEMHGRDQLASMLWPDADLESARTSLRTALAALRKLLEPADHALVADRQQVGLDPDAVDSDARSFERLTEMAARAKDSTARETARAAAAEAYAGPFLPGFREEWARQIRERLAAARERALSPEEPAPPVVTPTPTPADSEGAAGPRANLPVPLTTFFGRDSEIESILGVIRVGGARLVTLTGPGGSGKTRLALEAARLWAAESRASVVFVALADVGDSTFLPDAMLQALRVDRAAHSPAIDQVIHALGTGPSLLVLDNFEHLIDAGVDAVLRLLRDASQVTCLVTSRQRLDIGGECEIPIAPLPIPGGAAVLEELERCTSVQLYVDRARAARREFALTPSNAPAVAAICDRLQGMPLAIELAAAWSSALTPAQIYERLCQSLDILASRRKDLAPRHRTLRATIAWSYQLLPPELQRFFARLSVFRGGWTLEAAEIVCAERDALMFLHHLLDRSLVAAEEAGSAMRYRCLETLREFAAEQLTSESAEALHERHARWCLRIAESARVHLLGASQAEWLRRLEAEHENFRAALQRAVESQPELALRLATALDRFWEVRGFVSEGLDWLDRALAAAPPSSPLRPVALDLAGRFAWFSNRFDVARERFEESLELSRALGPDAIAGPLAHLARMEAFIAGDTARSRTLLHEALEIATRTGDSAQVQNILEMLCQVSLIEGDIPAAVRRGGEWHAAAREAGDATSIAGSLVMWGIALMNAGEFERAGALFEEAIGRSVDLGERYWWAGACWGLGVIALRENRLDEAAGRFRESLEKLKDTGFEVVKHFVLEALGFLAGARGEAARAARLLGAVARMQRDSLAPPARILHLDFSREVERAVAELGPDAYDAERAEGGKMNMTEAFEYAMAGLAAGAGLRDMDIDVRLRR